MAREFLLVPKQKYESMIQSLEEKKTEPRKQPEPNQDGGQNAELAKNSDSLEVNDKKGEILESTVVPKTPATLYVKRPLAEMDFMVEREKPPKKRPKTTKQKTEKQKMKWINYTV